MRNQPDCMKAYGVVLMAASLAPVDEGVTALAVAVSGSAMRQGSQTLGALRGPCSRPPLRCWPKCFPGGSRSVGPAVIRDLFRGGMAGACTSPAGCAPSTSQRDSASPRQGLLLMVSTLPPQKLSRASMGMLRDAP